MFGLGDAVEVLGAFDWNVSPLGGFLFRVDPELLEDELLFRAPWEMAGDILPWVCLLDYGSGNGFFASGGSWVVVNYPAEPHGGDGTIRVSDELNELFEFHIIPFCCVVLHPASARTPVRDRAGPGCRFGHILPG